MTDQQILTLVIAIAFPIAALIYSSVATKDRIGGVEKRIDDTNKRLDEMNGNMKDMEKRLIAHLDNAFEHMTMLLKLHEAEHHRSK